MTLVDALKKIGFTQQEALLYITLCQYGELTGYEAAKKTGISRSNAYAALSNLSEKGYANQIQGNTTKYIAVPKEELMLNINRDFSETIDFIEKHLNFNESLQEPYVTITLAENVINKLKNMIILATERFYLSCSHEMQLKLKVEILKANEKGLKIVILSPIKMNADISYTHYYKESDESFKLIVDTNEVCAGSSNQALYSKNNTLVTLIRESFINEISVINTTDKTV